MNMMLDDHKNDVKEFEKAGNDLNDPDIKNFAMKTLPTLQKHLDSAKAITNNH
jgi:putative membrane protein